MSNVFNLDILRNGTSGAPERFISAFQDARVGLLPVNIFHEAPSMSINGDIPNISKYRDLAHQRSEWVEAAMLLRDVHLSGRFKSPSFGKTKKVVVGSAVNMVVDAVEAPAGSNAISRDMKNAYLVGGRGGAVYGHWLLDFIPQLITAMQVEQRYGFDFPIIVANCPKFGRDLISILGMEDRFVFPSQSENLYVENIIVPLITKHGPRYSVDVLTNSFDRLSLGSAAPNGNRNLLIGRRKPPYASNFQDLCDKLIPLGFDLVFPEDYSLSDQFYLFGSAKVVVGEDGSALHNAGFCSSGGHLIVYSRGRKTNYWHASVAESAGISLTYLQSEIEGEDHRAPIEAILSTLVDLKITS